MADIQGFGLLIAAWLTRGSSPRRLKFMLTAARRLRSAWSRHILRRLLRPYLSGPAASVWRHKQVGWARYEHEFGGLDTHALATSLLLKTPGPNGEKGVLYSSFEYNWMRLIAHYDAKRFFERYMLVGATSWSPPDYAPFASLAGLSADPIFIGISNVVDLRHYRLFEPVIAPVPLMACDWIDPSRYLPRPYDEREIDILMVANWLPFKRHWLLFEALRRMDPRLRVVLIGYKGGNRTADDVWREARLFGVRQRLELLTNVSTDDIASYQCNSKIATLFSDREGSCVAVTECMFADTPVAMMKHAHVGAKAHINPETGALVTRGSIHRELSVLLERAMNMNARTWAMNNISCQKSSDMLNEQLRTYCQQSGQVWTRDIVPLQWRYVPAYLHDSDRQALQGGLDQLYAEHGIELIRYPYIPQDASPAS